MKLKDLKPGMEVAIGSMASVNGRYGGWANAGHFAVVVGIEKLYKGSSWRSEWSQSSTGQKKVIVAVKAYTSDLDIPLKDQEWRPEVYTPSQILCTWDEYVGNVEAEKVERAIAFRQQKKNVETSQKRVEAIEKSMREILDDKSVKVHPDGYRVTLEPKYLEELLEAYNKIAEAENYQLQCELKNAGIMED